MRTFIADTVSNEAFIEWGDNVRAQAKQIQASSGPQTPRTEELARTVQDLLAQGLMGALFPPQRADVLRSLVIGRNGTKCAVTGCHMPTCRGNRVLTRAEYEYEYGSTTRQEHQRSYEYFIVVSHCKNYANEQRARYQGPTVHTPEELGPTIQFLLHQIVTWAGGLMRDLHGSGDHQWSTQYSGSRDHHGGGDDYDDGDDDDEQSTHGHGGEEFDENTPAQVSKYAFIEYVTGCPFNDNQDMFNRYVQRITSPEVGLSPCNFRFLFVRKVEIRISQDSVSEADSLRNAFARQMLTSLETWRKTYALPAPSLPQSGHLMARTLAFGDA